MPGLGGRGARRRSAEVSPWCSGAVGLGWRVGLTDGRHGGIMQDRADLFHVQAACRVVPLHHPVDHAQNAVSENGGVPVTEDAGVLTGAYAINEQVVILSSLIHISL